MKIVLAWHCVLAYYYTQAHTVHFVVPLILAVSHDITLTPLKLKVTERCSAVPQNSAVIASQWPVGCVEAADQRCTRRCAHLECGHMCLHSYHSYLLSR